ncbi:MAG: hypothetical protein SOV75_14175 [Candidatus Limiplasma sp.]|nr:hypothetical protein [Candidatus Limiplasma sp.]
MKKRVLLNFIPFLSALPGIVAGSLVMHLHQLPASVYLQNIAAWLVGGICSCIYLSMSHRVKKRVWGGYAAVIACAAALCCTFFDSGTGGVHRWIRLGPVAVNVAFVFIPVALAGTDLLFRAGKQRDAYILCLVIGVLLFFQPDASMIGALALAMLPTLWHEHGHKALQWTVLCALFVLALISWVRFQSPEPVLHVEGILNLAKSSGWVYWLVSMLSLLILFWPFAAGMRSSSARFFLTSSMLFYAGLLASTCTGMFPVPIIGSGVSPIIGYLISATCAMQRLKACER